MPAPPFAVFEATLDPGPEPVPSHVGAGGGQIGQDQPGLAIASVPSRQQRTCELAGGGGKADDGTGPPLAQPADHLRQGAKGRAGLRAIVPLPIDPEGCFAPWLLLTLGSLRPWLRDKRFGS